MKKGISPLDLARLGLTIDDIGFTHQDLADIENIFGQLGAMEGPKKEREICKRIAQKCANIQQVLIYKNGQKFTVH